MRTLLRSAVTPSPSTAPSATAFAARLKKSTNITGLDVSTSPLSELESRYTKTLSLLSTLPEQSVYRQATSALTQQRLDIVAKFNGQAKAVSSKPDQLEELYEQAEQELDAGQLEQVLEQAVAEYRLAAKMVDWKAWEPLEHPPAPGQWSYFSMAEEAGEGGEDQNVDGGKK
ncbi:potential mitochondrial Complex I, B13_NDUFA5 subunit [Pseudozyma hubeiensis SY62]|uniref:Potential mitochondrial Complex I, B13_NDUFA5 subunit n=1 Tax=Pseudozyma hubeiensis (strain SY62) TaxID=1305764 RepID=R9PE20_PSEHS|nr:potential mitochondrial Complex I, B13_NDUFA5 subunit [Pseudozyma hubeiensis SY62]GAC99606.1 potential mitochondrial Complex I, B13_NDUFA5 subunit [Pseudozyma hubeiensis SY62]